MRTRLVLAVAALARCAGRIVHPRVANLTRDFDMCVSDLKLNRQLVPLVLRADMSVADAVAAVCRPRGPGDPADAALIAAWIEHKVSQTLYTRAPSCLRKYIGGCSGSGQRCRDVLGSAL